MRLLEVKHIFLKVTKLKQANRIYTAEKNKGIMCCTQPFEQLMSYMPFLERLRLLFILIQLLQTGNKISF